MKIIHTGDWHIGKIVNQVYMTEDQAFRLQSLVAFLAIEKPDVLVIAGDVYDRSVPPVEAVELLDKTLSAILLDLKIPVLMIAGNHDSPDRLGFGSALLQAKGLYIAGRLQKDIMKVVLTDEYGPVNFFLVPYAPPALVREVFGCETIGDHDSAMQVMIESIKKTWNPSERNVMVTHGFVRGIEEVELSESEKPLSFTLSIGGADYVDVNQFAGFTYTALGHLHRPQQAGREFVRYAGSLLKYSLSEVNQKKSVTSVVLGEGNSIKVEQKILALQRDMRRIEGKLQELLEPAFYQEQVTDDYLFITLTDLDEVIEPMSKLRAVYPNILGLDFARPERSFGESKTAAGDGYKHKAKLELFRDFYCDITGQEFDEKKGRILAEVIQSVESAERGD